MKEFKLEKSSSVNCNCRYPIIMMRDHLLLDAICDAFLRF